MNHKKHRCIRSLFIRLKWKNFLGVRYYPALFQISMVLITICAIYPIFTFFCTQEGTAGTFGDQYGFINALISGLAFAAFWCSLQLQHKELKLQRKELRRANNEANNQTQQFEAQTKQFQEQIELARQAQFREDFYRRISILQQLEASIAYTYKKRNPTRNNEEYDVTEYGIEAIAHFYKHNARILDSIKENYSTLPYIAANEQTHNETLLVWKQNVLALLDDVKDIESHKEIILSRLSSHGKALIVFLSPDKPGTKKLFQPSDFPDELPGKKTLEYYHQIISIKLQNHIHGERAKNRVTKFILDNPPPPKPQS